MMMQRGGVTGRQHLRHCRPAHLGASEEEEEEEEEEDEQEDSQTRGKPLQ